MEKSKVRLMRNDKVLRIKSRHFKLPNDDTTYIAHASYQKKSFGTKESNVFPKGKEYWVGYYTSEGRQQGLGFFKKKSEIPNKYKEAFEGKGMTARRK
jgi:hypothetical protein